LIQSTAAPGSFWKFLADFYGIRTKSRFSSTGIPPAPGFAPDGGYCLQSTNANRVNTSSSRLEFVEVTHPFHPWCGRRFKIHGEVTAGEPAMVRCVVDDQVIRTLPIAWTNLRKADDYELASGGKSLFRHDDLEALRAQVDALLHNQK